MIVIKLMMLGIRIAMLFKCRLLECGLALVALRIDEYEFWYLLNLCVELRTRGNVGLSRFIDMIQTTFSFFSLW